MAYSLQIYFDFYGYSLMAMGLGKMIGFSLPVNFRHPYLSCTMTEFWRRWHITLGSWFRDYLYIPLGGNRKGTLRKYLNVLVTFAVSGLWHGAQWNYMAWGLLNGLYQVIGAALMPLRTAVVRALHIDPKSRPHKLLRVVVTFVLFSSTMVFFRAYRLMDAVRIFISMLTVHNFEIFTDGSIFACGIGHLCRRCLQVQADKSALCHRKAALALSGGRGGAGRADGAAAGCLRPRLRGIQFHLFAVLRERSRKYG